VRVDLELHRRKHLEAFRIESQAMFADIVLDAAIVNVAIPTIGRDLDFSLENLAWIPNAYALTFGGFLLVAGLLHYMVHAESRAQAGLRIALGALIVCVLYAGSSLVSKHEDIGLAHVLESGTKAERIQALAQVAQQPERWSEIQALCPALLQKGEIEVRLSLLELIGARKEKSLLPQVHALLSDKDDTQGTLREGALQCVRTLADPSSREPLFTAASAEEDEYLRVELAEALIELGDARGIPILLGVMQDGESRQARKDAWEHVSAHLKPPLAFHPELEGAGRAGEVHALTDWWGAHPDALQVR